MTGNYLAGLRPAWITERDSAGTILFVCSRWKFHDATARALVGRGVRPCQFRSARRDTDDICAAIVHRSADPPDRRMDGVRSRGLLRGFYAIALGAHARVDSWKPVCRSIGQSPCGSVARCLAVRVVGHNALWPSSASRRQSPCVRSAGRGAFRRLPHFDRRHLLPEAAGRTCDDVVDIYDRARLAAAHRHLADRKNCIRRGTCRHAVRRDPCVDECRARRRIRFDLFAICAPLALASCCWRVHRPVLAASIAARHLVLSLRSTTRRTIELRWIREQTRATRASRAGIMDRVGSELSWH
jgi:hypothetical protein